jgi:hypothetical protein
MTHSEAPNRLAVREHAAGERGLTAPKNRRIPVKPRIKAPGLW